MKRNIAIGLVALTVGYGASVKGNRQPVVLAVPVYTVGNAVEVAVNGLEQQGYQLIQVQPLENYYLDGTQVTLIWVRGFGELPTYHEYAFASNPDPDEVRHVDSLPKPGCADYDPLTPGVQGPFPGAVCYPDGGWR